MLPVIPIAIRGPEVEKASDAGADAIGDGDHEELIAQRGDSDE